MANTTPRPFAPAPPDPPQVPVTVQEPPASLGAHLWRIVAVGGLLFAAPLYGLIWLGLANWFGAWAFFAFGVPGLVVIAAGVLLLCLEPLDWFQAFRYRQLGRRQDHYHRGLVVQTQVFALRMWVLNHLRHGERTSATERIVLHRVWTDTPIHPETSHSARYSAAGVTLDDDQEAAEIIDVEPERVTQQIGTRADGWTAEMVAVWNIRRPDGTCPLPYAKARGVSQPRWTRGMDGFRQRGLLVERPGTATRILG